MRVALVGCGDRGRTQVPGLLANPRLRERIDLPPEGVEGNPPWTMLEERG